MEALLFSSNSFAYKFMRVHFIIFVFIGALTSCTGERENQSQQSKPVEATTTAADVQACNNFTLKFTDPRNRNQTTCAIQKFAELYAVNTSIDMKDIDVPFNVSLKSAFKMFKAEADSGLVFHYGLIKSNGKNKLVYMLSLGVKAKVASTNRDTINYFPFPKGNRIEFPTGVQEPSNAFYIVLSNGLSVANTYILKNDFCTYKNNYKTEFEIKASNGDTVSIGSNHPLMVFHQGVELNQFYEEYSNINSLHLKLKHGAATTDTNIPKYHMPFLLFGNETNTFPIDDVDYTVYGSQFRYHHKSLDVGHLCPPLCGNQNAYICSN